MQADISTPDLLTDEKYNFRADTNKRFFNYIIDLISFYVVIFSITFILAFAAPSLINDLSNSIDELGPFDRILSIILYALYMSLIEAVFNGKTLGKMITKTRAVNLDGTRISFSTAFARGFSRAVPFCVFSAFGTPCNPWQDRWTDTMVIDEKKSLIE